MFRPFYFSCMERKTIQDIWCPLFLLFLGGSIQNFSICTLMKTSWEYSVQVESASSSFKHLSEAKCET